MSRYFLLPIRTIYFGQNIGKDKLQAITGTGPHCFFWPKKKSFSFWAGPVSWACIKPKSNALASVNMKTKPQYYHTWTSFVSRDTAWPKKQKNKRKGKKKLNNECDWWVASWALCRTFQRQSFSERTEPKITQKVFFRKSFLVLVVSMLRNLAHFCSSKKFIC